MKYSTSLAVFGVACFLGGFVVGIKCTLAIVTNGQAPATSQAIHAPATPFPRPAMRPTPEPTPRVIISL